MKEYREKGQFEPETDINNDISSENGQFEEETDNNYYASSDNIPLEPTSPPQTNDATTASSDDNTHRTSPNRSSAVMATVSREEDRKILNTDANSKRKI